MHALKARALALGMTLAYHVEDIDIRHLPRRLSQGWCEDCEAELAGIWFFKKREHHEGEAMFAHQPQRDYESQTRSLRIGGHCTSIRLEKSFWDTLEEIAEKQNMSLAKFLTTLHDEVLDHHGEVRNFASLLRCSCLIYRSRFVAGVATFEETARPVLDAAE
jgi:predicted DNA-binding ribbon-helix-helix protein